MSELNSPAVVTTAAASIQARGDSQRARQYLTFMLSGEIFALGILSIKEIIEYTNLTPVPMTPDFMRGVMNLRGAVVPVLDLSVRFGRPASPVSKRTCIVIVEIASAEGQLTVGVVVDAVNAVVDIDPAEIERPPAFGSNVRTEFMEGMGRINGRFVILLEVNRMIAMDEMPAVGVEAACGP
ncbi:MAG TPA: chemotaxis protein CheW [Steroidobacteraceae bacterium]